MKRPPWSVLIGAALGYLFKPKRLPTPAPGLPEHDPSEPSPWPGGTVECAVCGAFVARPRYTEHLMQHADGERPA